MQEQGQAKHYGCYLRSQVSSSESFTCDALDAEMGSNFLKYSLFLTADFCVAIWDSAAESARLGQQLHPVGQAEEQGHRDPPLPTCCQCSHPSPPPCALLAQQVCTQHTGQGTCLNRREFRAAGSHKCFSNLVCIEIRTSGHHFLSGNCQQPKATNQKWL